MTALIPQRDTVAARVYSGRWIVDCPVCNNAERLDFDTPVWSCNNCWVQHEISWPTHELASGIVRLLSMRPVPMTRNWFPHETLHDLLAENVEHGIGPVEEGQRMHIIGDTITVDTLPAVDRLQIGG